MRDQIIALACLRAGLPLHEGRGVDRLPEPCLAALAEPRSRDVDLDELRRSLVATTTLLLDQVAVDDPELADELRVPVRSVAGRE